MADLISLDGHKLSKGPNGPSIVPPPERSMDRIEIEYYSGERNVATGFPVVANEWFGYTDENGHLDAVIPFSGLKSANMTQMVASENTSEDEEPKSL